MNKQNELDFGEEDEVKSNLIFWDYKTEKELIGTFKQFVSDSYGKHAVVEVVRGEEIHLPNLTALNGKLANAKENDRIKIVYLAEVKSKKSGRTYSDFKVFIKKIE